MKRLLVLAVVLALAGCEEQEQGVLHGYVEGEFLRLGPRDPGIVTTLEVSEGDEVKRGAALFAVDAERARLAVDEAEAQLKAANERVDDLLAGGRPEEVKATREQLAQARAQAELARETFARTRSLAEKGWVSQQKVDQDGRSLESANAKVDELEARLALAAQPARKNQIEAARRESDAAKAALGQALQALADRSVAAPAAGRVDQIYLRPGEFAGAGQPVLSLLPPDRVKVRFFIPEPELGRVHVGDAIAVACDACAAGLQATITFINSEAEFTPPVIFSSEERAKLVFMAEAKLQGGVQLKPGQPVEARLLP